jgi:hypothetical protein
MLRGQLNGWIRILRNQMEKVSNFEECDKPVEAVLKVQHSKIKAKLEQEKRNRKG